jgi:hypothetical protein
VLSYDPKYPPLLVISKEFVEPNARAAERRDAEAFAVHICSLGDDPVVPVSAQIRNLACNLSFGDVIRAVVFSHT